VLWISQSLLNGSDLNRSPLVLSLRGSSKVIFLSEDRCGVRWCTNCRFDNQVLLVDLLKIGIIHDVGCSYWSNPWTCAAYPA